MSYSYNYIRYGEDDGGDLAGEYYIYVYGAKSSYYSLLA